MGITTGGLPSGIGAEQAAAAGAQISASRTEAPSAALKGVTPLVRPTDPRPAYGAGETSGDGKEKEELVSEIVRRVVEQLK
jgi:hypothetical protein